MTNPKEATREALPADLEALMPEPFGYVPFPGEFYPPNELDAEVKNDWATIAVYTADQMREAIRGATERAAKLCDADAADTRNRVASGDWHAASGDYYVEGCLDGAGSCAAAIRGEK